MLLPIAIVVITVLSSCSGTISGSIEKGYPCHSCLPPPPPPPSDPCCDPCYDPCGSNWTYGYFAANATSAPTPTQTTNDPNYYYGHHKSTGTTIPGRVKTNSSAAVNASHNSQGSNIQKESARVLAQNAPKKDNTAVKFIPIKKENKNVVKAAKKNNIKQQLNKQAPKKKIPKQR